MDSLADEVEGIFVRCHPVPPEFPILSRLENVICYAPEQFNCHYTEFKGTFDDLVKGLGQNSRSRFKRLVSRYRKLCGGEIPVQEFRRSQEMEEFLRLARKVSSRSYQEKFLAGGIPNTPSFSQRLHERALGDQVRGYILFHGSKPVAYQLLRHQEGILFEPLYGYDMDYSKNGVGAVLQFCLVERWFSEGTYRILDNGPGDEYHRKVLAANCVRCGDLYFLRRRLRNRALVRLHRGNDILSKGMGRLLQAVGLKDRVKKLVWSKYCLPLCLSGTTTLDAIPALA
jgi:hypothetical protein